MRVEKCKLMSKLTQLKGQIAELDKEIENAFQDIERINDVTQDSRITKPELLVINPFYVNYNLNSLASLDKI